MNNVEDIINLIEQNNKKSNFYTLGIGSGSSSNLIVNSAKAGSGKSEFVINSEDITKKVIALLKHSMRKTFLNFKFIYDETIVDKIIPDLN